MPLNIPTASNPVLQAAINRGAVQSNQLVSFQQPQSSANQAPPQQPVQKIIPYGFSQAPQPNPIVAGAVSAGAISSNQFVNVQDNGVVEVKPISKPQPVAQVPIPASGPPPMIPGGTLVPTKTEAVKMFGFKSVGTQEVQFQQPQQFYNVESGTVELKSSVVETVFSFGPSSYDPFRFNTKSGAREVLTEMILPQTGPTQLFENVPNKPPVTQSAPPIPFLSSAAEVIIGLKAGQGEVSPSYVPGLTGVELAKVGFASAAIEAGTFLLPEVGAIGLSKLGIKAAEPTAQSFTKVLSGESASGDILSVGTSRVAIGKKVFNYDVSAISKTLKADVSYSVSKEFEIPSTSTVPDIGFFGKVETIPKGTVFSDIQLWKPDKSLLTAKGSFNALEEPIIPTKLISQKQIGEQGIILSGTPVQKGVGNVILEAPKPSYANIKAVTSGDVSISAYGPDLSVSKSLDQSFKFVESRSKIVGPSGKTSFSAESTLAKTIDQRNNLLGFTRPTVARTDVLKDLGQSTFFKELGVSKFSGADLELIRNRPPEFFGSMSEAIKAENQASKSQIESMVSSAAVQAARREYSLTRDFTGFTSTSPYVVTPMLRSSARTSGYDLLKGNVRAQKMSFALRKSTESLGDVVSSDIGSISAIQVDTSYLNRFDNKLNPMFQVQSSAQKNNNVVIPAITSGLKYDSETAMVIIQKQATKQSTKLISQTVNSDFFFKAPTLPASTFLPIGFPLPVSGGSFGTGSVFKRKQSRRYSPSLIGILSGKTTSKIPKTLTGMEIRLPYSRKGR